MKIPKPVSERRRSVRIAEGIPFTIGHRNYETEVATTVNISAHGALCLVERDFPLMTQLKVTLSLPDAHKKGLRSPQVISMKGVVVRKETIASDKSYLLAIYFSDIKPRDQHFLEKFIEGRLSADA